MKRVYDTANFYHFIHSLALFAVPLANRPALVSEFIYYALPLDVQIIHVCFKGRTQAGKF